MLKQKCKNGFILTFIIPNGDIITTDEYRFKSHEDNNILSRESQAYSLSSLGLGLLDIKNPLRYIPKNNLLNFDFIPSLKCFILELGIDT